MPLQIRRGTNAQRQILAVPLASGELLWTTDTQQLFIGDGVSLANALTPVVGYGDAEAQDASAAIFTNGSHTDISFNYNTVSNTISANVSLSAFTQNVNMGAFNLTGSGNINTTGDIFSSGTISATLFEGNYKGSIFGDDSALLIDALNSSINLDGTVKGNIIPDTSLVYDIGSGSRRFNDLYLSGSSIFLGDAVINSVGTAVNLPSGSTIGGEPLGAATFAGTDLNVNIIGDDSSVIVNTSTNTISATTITGSFVGDIKGSVFADDSTLIIDGNSRLISNGVINISNATISSTNFDTDVEAFTLTVGDEDAPSGSGTTLVINAPTPDRATLVKTILGILPDAPKISFLGHGNSLSSPVAVSSSGDIIGAFSFDVYEPNTNASLPASLIIGKTDPDGVVSSTVANGKLEFLTAGGTSGLTINYLTFNSSGQLAVNKETASATLDVNGDAIISGGLTADVTGSLFSDASTMLIDGTDGKLMVANVNMVGETGNTPGTTGSVDSWLEVTVNGATKYIPLYV